MGRAVCCWSCMAGLGLGFGLLLAGSGALSAPADAVALSTQEIRERFSNVRDDAEVQDEAGSRAVNDWYADGRFIVRWRNQSGSGEVTGEWWAENDMRCITIQTGLPEREGETACSPLYQRGDVLISIEPDGSIHAIHRLSPLPEAPDQST